MNATAPAKAPRMPFGFSISAKVRNKSKLRAGFTEVTFIADLY